MRHRDTAGSPGVIDRCAAVLSLFARKSGPLCMTAICRETGLAKATTHRLLTQMIQSGLMERVEGGYQPASLLWQISLSSARARFLELARPALVDLHRRSGCIVHVGAMRGDSVLYLEKIHSGPACVGTRVGGVEPAYCTALGRVMLAFMDEGAVLRQMLAPGLRKRTTATITDPRRLRAVLAGVADSRVAVDDGEHTVGVRCIAAPIFEGGMNTPPHLAVSLSSFSASLNERHWRGELLQLTKTLQSAYVRANSLAEV